MVLCILKSVECGECDTMEDESSVNVVYEWRKKKKSGNWISSHEIDMFRI